MKIFRRVFFLIVLLAAVSFLKAQNSDSSKHWFNLTTSSVPNIPILEGVSGTFVGVSKNVLIIAGGSYFDRPLKEGGEKIYIDSIFVCLKEGNSYKWKFAGNLPYPVANGAAVSIGSGVLCMGGQDNDQKFSNVFLLRWDELTQSVVIDKGYPVLPEACSYITASLINNTVYVAGGKILVNKKEVASNNFWEMELEQHDESKWQSLESWPGPSRFGSSLVTQTNGDNACLFLFGGKSDSLYFSDAYMFNPKKKGKNNQWKKLSDMPRPAIVASTLAIGGSQVLVFIDSDGHNFDNIVEIKNNYHYVSEILSYNTITNTYYRAGELPQGVANTTALMWNGSIIIPGGEISPGTTTPEVMTATINPEKRGNFAILDYIVLFVYLLLILWLGYYFSSKNKSSKDFFLGGQKIPFWAAGLSMMSAQVSAVGFMSIPAKAFATNWSYFVGTFTWFIAVPIVIYAFVPFYRRLNVTSAYEYLDKRFNSFIRSFTAGLYLLFQLIGRLAAMIYLPAIALSAVTGMNTAICILIIGCLATTYTVLGGMQAVIWIDVIQAILMVGSIFICVVFVIFNVEGGINEVLSVAWNDSKFSFGSMDFDLTASVFWVIIIGNIFNRIGTMSTDQSVVQRYLTTRNEKETAKALWTDVAVSIPWALFVFSLGTALYVYYKTNPELLNPIMANDEIVPFFIGQNLPTGISGIIIAGIFAASMSSVDSSIHSSTTVLMRDFLYRRVKSMSELKKVSLARWITGVIGMMGTIIAVVMTFFDINSVWDIVLEFAGLFTGAMTGVFILGIFSTRANGKGAAIGAVASAAILLFVKSFTPLHFFLYSSIGIVSCVLIGYLASFLFTSAKSTEGLTIYSTLRKKVNG